MNIFEAFKAIKEGKMVILSQPTYLRIFRFNKELKCVEIKNSFKGEWGRLFTDINYLFAKDFEFEIYEEEKEEEKKPVYRVDMSWLSDMKTVGATMGMAHFSYFPAKNDFELNHWIKALGTFFYLKSHPLAKSLILGETQFLLEPSIYSKEIIISGYIDSLWKTSNASSLFKSEQDARQALKDIGEDNIFHMFKTFQGIYE